MARAGEKPLPGEAPVLGGGSQGSQSNRSQSNRSQSNSGQSNGSQNNAGKKQIALTFDDGPHSEYTLKLLEGLKERNVRATFFLMGQNIPGNEELIRRMQEDGHLIGNHSYRHVQLTQEGEESVCQAVEKTSSLIAQITGQTPQYLRPPYGDWSEGLECRLDLTPVFWSVDSLDWKLKNTAKIVRRVEKYAGEGDIILMHDIFQTSVDAALALVDDLQRQGYEFVTVDELVIE
ncbi:MAG: polysaccharide deacetylase family protein [Lachnospiraceae bacterium]|nr:polysaccharide deacetylase family protein [Lachnospiraceae bacterium]